MKVFPANDTLYQLFQYVDGSNGFRHANLLLFPSDVEVAHGEFRTPFYFIKYFFLFFLIVLPYFMACFLRPDMALLT